MEKSNCKDCFGCNQLENPEFIEIEDCTNYIKANKHNGVIKFMILEILIFIEYLILLYMIVNRV